MGECREANGGGGVAVVKGGGRGDSRAVLAAEVLLGELHLELLAPQGGLAGAEGPSHDLGLQNLQL